MWAQEIEEIEVIEEIEEIGLRPLTFALGPSSFVLCPLTFEIK